MINRKKSISFLHTGKRATTGFHGPPFGKGKGWIPFFFLLTLAILPSDLFSQVYTPPGYGEGQHMEGSGWYMETGVKQVGDDYYLTLTPGFHLQMWKLKVGLEVPLDILVYDKEPLTGQKVPSLREGMYEEPEDFARLIGYIRYGSHNYFDPDDPYNWSVYYGKMSDGYIGHKTIIHRYVTSFDPTVYRAGFMAEINNPVGGVEVFSSDIFRREVNAGRVFIRPFGLLVGVHNLLFAYDSRDTKRMVALSDREYRDPDLNGGIFFQERIPQYGKGGSLKQHLYRPLGEELGENKQNNFEFEEVVNPDSGEVEIRAVPLPDIPEEEKSGAEPVKLPDDSEKGGKSGNKDPNATEPEKLPGEKEKSSGKSGSSHWAQSFFSRWAIGYTVARDINAPLTLETDGSGNLVLDPDLNLPREASAETLTIEGVDTEFRISPFDFLELTPYVDVNKVKYLDKSKGIHGGINTEIKLGNSLRLYLRPEYREVTENYIPVYFDSYYSLERTNYNPGGTGSSAGTSSSITQTKLAYLKSLPSGGDLKKGMFMEMMLDWVETLVVEGSYEDYDGIDNSSVFVGVYVPPTFLFNIFFNGYYIKKNFDQMKDSFVFDDRSLMAAEAGIELFGGFYVNATLYRTWTFDSVTSTYKTQDEVVYGFGFSSSL